MSVGFRRKAAVIGSLSLLCSLGLGGWEQLTSGTRAELLSVHFPTGTQVGYAVGTDTTGYGTILKTTNGGNTWVPQTSGMENGVYDVYFTNDSTGYAVSGGTLLRTADGGATWNPKAPPGGMQRLNTVQFPENGQVGYIVATPHGIGGRVLKTADGGDNWTAITVGAPMHTSRGGCFATDSIGVIVGNGGMVLMTTDGLGSTTISGPLTTADLVAAALSPTDPTKGYIIGSDTIKGVIRYTDDGGVNLWDSVRCWPTTAFYGVDMPTSDVAYICGTGGFIGRTVSATDIWATTVPEGLAASMHGLCFPNGADTGYAVGAGGTILRTYDAGIPWIPGVAEGKAPAVNPAGIRVVSNPSRHGITFRADAAVDIVVLDAAGRTVARQVATRGLNFLPLSKAGVYFVRVATEGFSTTQKLVVEH